MSIRLLSTKILTPSQKAILSNSSILVDNYDAIQISYIPIKIDPAYKNLIFTSQHAVKAFLQNYPKTAYNHQDLKAYCVGEKTKALVSDQGIQVVEMTHYGAQLAQRLVDKHPEKTFLFLCSDKRRDDIPNLLTKHKVAFKEQIAYQNTPNPLTFAADYKGILFFSPSGLESFMTNNRIGNSVAICIGTTTAAEAKKHSKNVITANNPTVESVLEKAVEHFKTQTN
ncbi:uroporphyrinogen-III synthase [Arenibacter aquaticus]|uniref:Uroporphyrinogen-III synthase n=1 Tax=Arenibacter aquaticus TaxID=2489054 RepID=A0A3S0CA36_9FLAO|nr:uroporphyrinogen-III synthase [Arenibacter aquaticus]RTE55567.1 uroporphyrinogen-III synthase [Arenibacter aquaticus]